MRSNGSHRLSFQKSHVAFAKKSLFFAYGFSGWLVGNRNTWDAHMPEDEIDFANPESVPACQPLPAANDNGTDERPTVDLRILVVTRAIGRQIAREQLNQIQAANDNTSRDD